MIRACLAAVVIMSLLAGMAEGEKDDGYTFDISITIVFAKQPESSIAMEMKGWARGDCVRTEGIARQKGRTLQRIGIRDREASYGLRPASKQAFRSAHDPHSSELEHAPYQTLLQRAKMRGWVRVGSDRVRDDECDIWAAPPTAEDDQVETQRIWFRRSDGLPVRFESRTADAATGELANTSIHEWRNWRKGVAIDDRQFKVPADYAVEEVDRTVSGGASPL